MTLDDVAKRLGLRIVARMDRDGRVRVRLAHPACDTQGRAMFVDPTEPVGVGDDEARARLELCFSLHGKWVRAGDGEIHLPDMINPDGMTKP